MSATLIILLIAILGVALIGVLRTTSLDSFPSGGIGTEFRVPGTPPAALETLTRAIEARRGWRVAEAREDELLVVTNPSGANWGMFYRLTACPSDGGTTLKCHLKAKLPARGIQYSKANDDLRRMLKQLFGVAEV